MNAKKILAVLMCTLLMTLIPVAAGAIDNQTNDPQTSDMGFTFIRGIITKPKLVDGGHSIEFRCIWVHYTTHGVGERQTGTLHMLQKLTLDNKFTGLIRSHMIFARFNGELDI